LRALDGGATLSQVSRRTGIARATLREWLSTGGTFHVRNQACPRAGKLDGDGYVHLLGLYLGDGCLSVHARGVYALRVACDARYPGLIDECADSMRAVVPNSVCFTSAPGCFQVTSYSKHWPCLFPQHGPGRKHDREIALQPWQAALVEQHPGRFLRGLFNSDGCRITNWTERIVAGERKRYEYPRYFFTNHSDDILGLCEWALDLLDMSTAARTPGTSPSPERLRWRSSTSTSARRADRSAPQRSTPSR
jgi:hypothetical protein